jgi:hypothetical protein
MSTKTNFLLLWILLAVFVFLVLSFAVVKAPYILLLAFATILAMVFVS